MCTLSLSHTHAYIYCTTLAQSQAVFARGARLPWQGGGSHIEGALLTKGPRCRCVIRTLSK